MGEKNLGKWEIAFALVVLIALAAAFWVYGPGTRWMATPTTVGSEVARKPVVASPKVPRLSDLLRPASAVSRGLAEEKGCLSCHEGIEDINPKMVGAEVTCTTCHRGDPLAATIDVAHQDLIVNPGDFRVVDKTCGQCHDDNGSIKQVVSRGQSNHVPRSLRSTMATAAGEIASIRYLWGAQTPKIALFAVRPISDTDGILPDSGVGVLELKQLPGANISNADNLLRTTCLKCHLWTEGESKAGLHRSSGCSACHVLYDDDGLSKSGDKSISTTETGHAARHEITVKVPTSQCLRCHNNGGARIGLNYVGQIVNPSGLPFQETGDRQPQLYDANTLHVKADVHYERGMDCIDCHTSREMHGDGNLYVRKEYEVGVQCESCHGTPSEAPTLRDSRGEPLWNLYRDGEDVVLEGKVSGKKHRVPQLKNSAETGGIPSAMRIPAHLTKQSGRSRLECAACHARTAQQCYGCHMKRDDRQVSPVDWVEGLGEGELARSVVGRWTGEPIYSRWEEPALGINSEGMVAPFVPGGQVFMTHIDESGQLLALNKAFDTAGISSQGAKLPGISMNPVQPHSIQKESRSCESCHNSSKAVGLGDGLLDSRAAGLPIDFPLDRMVDGQGIELQNSSHFGSRPFNKQEIARINLVESCAGCHQDTDKQTLWARIASLNGRATSARDHQDIISRIFKIGSQTGAEDW